MRLREELFVRRGYAWLKNGGQISRSKDPLNVCRKEWVELRVKGTGLAPFLRRQAFMRNRQQDCKVSVSGNPAFLPHSERNFSLVEGPIESSQGRDDAQLHHSSECFKSELSKISRDRFRSLCRTVASSGHVSLPIFSPLIPTPALMVDRMVSNGRTTFYRSMLHIADESPGDDLQGTSVDGGSHRGKAYDEIAEKILKVLKKCGPNYQALEELQVQLSPFVVCRVLKEKMSADVAWKFFKWAKTQKGYHHNVYTYTAMLDRFGKAKDFKAIETVLAEMRKGGCGMSIVTFTSLMHWYRRDKNLEGVRRVWQHMHEQDCPPNEFTYTTLIDALIKGGCHQEAMDVYREMLESGCRPNIYTYTVLIHSLVEAEKLDVACNLLQKLGQLGCRPNWVTYSLLIKAHANAGDLEKAMFLHKSMSELGLTPSPEARVALTTALRESGRRTEAEELTLLHKTESKKNQEDLKVFPTRLPQPEKLAKMLRCWEADMDKTLESLKPKLKPPYVLNVLTLLSREVDVAWRFFEWLTAHFGQTKYTYTKMMDIIGKAGNTELIQKVLGEAEREGQVNTVTFNTLIKCYSKAKHVDAALQVFGQMQELGHEPNEITYTMLIDLLSRTRNHHQAMQMYGKMRQANCKPTKHTYTVIIHSLARAGKVNAAQTLFGKMPSLECPPSAVTYTILMQAFAEAGDVDKAVQLYERMQEEGVKPSRVTLKVLAKWLRCAGREDEAQRVLKIMPHLQDSADYKETRGPSKAERDVHRTLSKQFF